MKKLFRNRWFWIATGVVVLALGAVGTITSRRGKVETVTVSRSRHRDVVQKVKAPGLIEPHTIVKISADISGRVVNLAVHEGDRVRQGQLLVQLDAAQYQSHASQARAAASAARARLRQAESAWKVAQTTYERRKALFARQLLSRAEMDAAENEFEAARNELVAAREEAARTSAAVGGASDNLAKTTIRSPIDGTITTLNVEQGEIVVVGTMNNPGTQILAVSDLSRMLVKADVDETDVVDVRMGQGATIRVDAIPDTTFAGTVTEISNSATRTQGTAGGSETNFEVKVLFSQTVPAVRPGMTADVEIEIRRAANALAIPIQAVVARQPRDLEERGKRRPRGGQAIAAGDEENESDDDPEARRKREVTGVFVVVGGKAQFRRIRTGISSDTEVQVVSGDLKDGEQVITGPYKVLRELRPGDAVRLPKRRAAAPPAKR